MTDKGTEKLKPTAHGGNKFEQLAHLENITIINMGATSCSSNNSSRTTAKSTPDNLSALALLTLILIKMELI